MKIALITGAGSGIGRTAAIALAEDGFDLVLAGRRVAPLEETVAQLRAEARTLIVPTDVSDPDAVATLFTQTEQVFGRLDVLFNNAGIGAPAIPMEDLTYAQWRAVLDTSLTGAFLCTQQAMRLMKKQAPAGGRIINNGSISAHTPRPFSAPYTAAKHGITGLTKSTNLDGRPFNITCGQIDIGNAGTNMTSRMSGGVPQADGAIRPEPTFELSHVADAILYMARLPLDVNVPFLTVMANQMPWVGRG